MFPIPASTMNRGRPLYTLGSTSGMHAPMPTQQQDTDVYLCYHLRGKCYCKCSHATAHHKLTSTEKSHIRSFIRDHLPPSSEGTPTDGGVGVDTKNIYNRGCYCEEEIATCYLNMAYCLHGQGNYEESLTFFSNQSRHSAQPVTQ